MSKKNALPGASGLYGGAKAGIRPPEDEDPADLPADVIRDFAEVTWALHARNDGHWGGPGCDMNFQEDCVQEYVDAVLDADLSDSVRVATGRPSDDHYQGAAYDENGAAGKGVAKAVDTVVEYVSDHPEHFPTALDDPEVAVQGLGAMGSALLERLDAMGYTIVAVSDLSLDATVVDRTGIDAEDALQAHRNRDADVLDGEQRPLDAVMGVDCDILIPAATGGVITADNAADVQAPAIVEAANNPVTREAKEDLYDDDVLVIPGESVNFGGSVAASVELDPSVDADRVVEESLQRTDEYVEAHARELMRQFVEMGGFDDGCSPHYVTDWTALERIVRAMSDRGDHVPDKIREIML